MPKNDPFEIAKHETSQRFPRIGEEESGAASWERWRGPEGQWVRGRVESRQGLGVGIKSKRHKETKSRIALSGKRRRIRDEEGDHAVSDY